jgi:hypothetical protein
MAAMSVQLRLPAEREVTKGVVYTKPWVVDLILDLVGYRPEADLATLVAVEPAAGEGAFLVPMVRRLLASLELHGRTIGDAKRALAAYELDGEASAWARELVVNELTGARIARREAERTAARWIVEGDYLLSSISGSPTGRTASGIQCPGPSSASWSWSKTSTR